MNKIKTRQLLESLSETKRLMRVDPVRQDAEWSRCWYWWGGRF
jgi:hypothetical protein